jgi:hypothetical protein
MKYAAASVMLAAASIVGLAACGGGGGPQPSPAASHITAPSSAPVHSAQPGGPALTAVPGYDYANIQSGPSAREIIKSDPQHLQSASAHMILHEGNMIAALVLIQVKPQYANLPELQQGMAPSFAKALAGSGAKVSTETIYTEKVTIARNGSTVTYCWYHGGVVAEVTGNNGPGIHNFVEAYLKTAHA